MKSTKIKIRNPENDKLGSSFRVLLDFLHTLNEDNPKDIIFDLSGLKFGTPFLILPICSKISVLKKDGINVEIVYSKTVQTNSYFEKILFPEGFDGLLNDNYIEFLKGYEFKTYLPVCRIPIPESEVNLRSQIISTLENVLLKQLNLTGQIITVIKYLISEAIDNIVEHSGCIDNGWIMVQNYPTKGYLDVCIVDTGQGIFGSYITTKRFEVNSSSHALEMAINGKSTKVLNETRGYGIDTSRRMLVEGLKGTYFLFSGDSFYVKTPDVDQINQLLKKHSWNGTMLALRIPKEIPKGFNYTTFLE